MHVQQGRVIDWVNIIIKKTKKTTNLFFLNYIKDTSDRRCKCFTGIIIREAFIGSKIYGRPVHKGSLEKWKKIDHTHFNHTYPSSHLNIKLVFSILLGGKITYII